MREPAVEGKPRHKPGAEPNYRQVGLRYMNRTLYQSLGGGMTGIWRVSHKCHELAITVSTSEMLDLAFVSMIPLA
jgi:hypothetical protein